MATDWERFADSVFEHMAKPQTRRAIAAVASRRLSAAPAAKCPIATIAAACRMHRARIAPVAACFGWLAVPGDRPGWVDVTRHKGGIGVLPLDDRETVCLYAVFRGSGLPVLSTITAADGCAAGLTTRLVP
jgi:hypothetical protein